MPGRKDKDGRVGKQGCRIVNVTGKANGEFYPQLTAQCFQRRFFRAFSGNHQMGGRESPPDTSECFQQEVEALLAREPANGEQMWAGAIRVIGNLIVCGTNLMHVHWVWQDHQPILLKRKLVGQVPGHCSSLADDKVCPAVEEPVQETGVDRQTSKGQSRRDRAVLAYKDARGSREERTQEQHEEIEVEHPG